jgi:hypothetical protein
MTSLQSDPDNILLGKIPYIPTWPLNIHIRPVLLKDYKVCDIVEAWDYHDLDDYRKIWITVEHNNKAIVKEKLEEPVFYKIDIRDDEPSDHSLTVFIHDKTDDHSCFDGKTSITVAVEIKIEIDDIPTNLLNPVFFKTIPLLIGENEKQYTAQFQTPIFRYMIENWGSVVYKDLKDISN